MAPAGVTSWIRMSIAMIPPTARAMTAYTPYNRPMSLWSTVVSQRMIPAGFSRLMTAVSSPVTAPPPASGVYERQFSTRVRSAATPTRRTAISPVSTISPATIVVLQDWDIIKGSIPAATTIKYGSHPALKPQNEGATSHCHPVASAVGLRNGLPETVRSVFVAQFAALFLGVLDGLPRVVGQDGEQQEHRDDQCELQP